MRSYLDKAGTIGGIFAALAAATPCCLPLLASAGASLGLGFLSPYQSVLSWVFQGFALLALLGVAVGFRRHKQLLPLLVMAAAFAAIIAYYHLLHQAAWLYGGLVGMVLAAIHNHRAAKQCNTCKPVQSVKPVVLQSVITCPSCGKSQTETMPTDSCQFFYECSGCKTVLRPKQGHCCVYCSYGSVACPSIQMQAGCCA